MKNNYSSLNMYLLVFLIASLTSACQPISESASKKEIKSNNANMLTTKRWQLVKLHSSAIELPKQQEIPFITFTASTDKVEGYAGCNNFFGGYIQKEQALTLSALGMTRRYCADTSALEIEFENMLAKVTNFKIIKNHLVLLADKDELATFSATE